MEKKYLQASLENYYFGIMVAGMLIVLTVVVAQFWKKKPYGRMVSEYKT